MTEKFNKIRTVLIYATAPLLFKFLAITFILCVLLAFSSLFVLIWGSAGLALKFFLTGGILGFIIMYIIYKLKTAIGKQIDAKLHSVGIDLKTTSDIESFKRQLEERMMENIEKLRIAMEEESKNNL